jgi:hypothetical protein
VTPVILKYSTSFSTPINSCVYFDLARISKWKFRNKLSSGRCIIFFSCEKARPAQQRRSKRPVFFTLHVCNEVNTSHQAFKHSERSASDSHQNCAGVDHKNDRRKKVRNEHHSHVLSSLISPIITSFSLHQCLVSCLTLVVQDYKRETVHQKEEERYRQNTSDARKMKKIS